MEGGNSSAAAQTLSHDPVQASRPEASAAHEHHLAEPTFGEHRMAVSSSQCADGRFGLELEDLNSNGDEWLRFGRL